MKPELQIIRGLALAICLVALALPNMAQEARPASRVLLTNVNVFDGEHEKLMETANVLVEGSLIKQISTHAISADGAMVVEGKGRTLIPGLIDAHWHTMLSFWPLRKVLAANFGYHSIAAANASRDTLQNGSEHLGSFWLKNIVEWKNLRTDRNWLENLKTAVPERVPGGANPSPSAIQSEVWILYVGDFMADAPIVVLALLLLLAGQPVLAQDTGVPTFRTGVSEVLVPTLVTDPQGNVVFGLQAQDFVIRDNGIAQTVRMDETFSYKPISLVVAVQTGGRAPSAIGSGCALQRDSNVFSRHTGECKSTLHGIGVMLETFVNVPGSEMALVSFDSTVKLRQNFSPDVSAVTKSLDSLPGGDSGAAMLDAMQFSLNLLKRRPKDHRKLLFVISAQRDQGSKTVTLEEAARQIVAGDVEVYMVAYPPDFASEAESVARLFGPANASAPGSPGPPGVVGPGSGASAAASFDILGLFSLLRSSVAEPNVPQTIANLTGGEYVLFKNTKNLDEALGLLANHVHNRYQLSFTARNPAPGPHKLEVGLRGGGNVIVSARAGYWPAEGSSQPPN